MGYFSNGTEGQSYEALFCDHCIHQNGPDGESGCAIWLAHMLHNYDECNNKESILHLLIPRCDDGLGNERCTMFWPVPNPKGGEPEPIVEMTTADHAYLEWKQKQDMAKHRPAEIPEPANKPSRRVA